MNEMMLILIIAVVVFITTVTLLSRYKRCPSDRYLRLATINPSQLYLSTRPLNADESNRNLNAEQPYPLQQKLPFQFGLKHYRNPEQQPPEPELEIRPPTEEEITQLSLNAGSSDAEGAL